MCRREDVVAGSCLRRGGAVGGVGGFDAVVCGVGAVRQRPSGIADVAVYVDRPQLRDGCRAERAGPGRRQPRDRGRNVACEVLRSNAAGVTCTPASPVVFATHCAAMRANSALPLPAIFGLDSMTSNLVAPSGIGNLKFEATSIRQKGVRNVPDTGCHRWWATRRCHRAARRLPFAVGSRPEPLRSELVAALCAWHAGYADRAGAHACLRTA